jgi:uncharacterized protein YdaU (DUF1376 family)
MHYYSHNIDEFRSLTINMSREARWIFRDMLDIIYRTEKPLQDDLVMICRQLGVRSEEEKAVVAEILLYEFDQVEGGYMHPRAAEQIAAYHSKADKARANGKSGGRRKTDPVKAETKAEAAATEVVSAETNPVPTRLDPQPTGNQELTGSEANYKPVTKNQEPRTKEKTKAASPAGDDVLFPDVDPQVVADFKALRAKKRAAITPTAMRDIASQAEKAGMTLEAALRVCCSRGWAGFEAEWVQPKGSPSATASPNQVRQSQAQSLVDRISGRRSHEPDARIIDIN